MGFYPFAPLSGPPSGAAGGVLSGTFPSPGFSLTAPPQVLEASSTNAGQALTGGTPTFLSWTAPSDGNLHTVVSYGYIDVTSAQTGGGIQLNYTAPVAGVQSEQMIGPSIGSTGISSYFNGSGVVARTVTPGSTSTISQSTAQTVGASVLYATLFGA